MARAPLSEREVGRWSAALAAAGVAPGGSCTECNACGNGHRPAPGQGAWLWGAPATGKSHLLQATCERFDDRAGASDRTAFTAFRDEQQSWLREFTVFMAIKEEQGGRAWPDWPVGLRAR